MINSININVLAFSMHPIIITIHYNHQLVYGFIIISVIIFNNSELIAIEWVLFKIHLSGWLYTFRPGSSQCPEESIRQRSSRIHQHDTPPSHMYFDPATL